LTGEVPAAAPAEGSGHAREEKKRNELPFERD
jgi:hypothetical protein